MSLTGGLDGLQMRFNAALDAMCVLNTEPTKIGVAVSGGGDSMALLELMRIWGHAELHVVSVNHGLRAEAAEELAQVTAYATRYGMPHDVLDWHWDGQGNLQNAARDARRASIAQWAQAQGISHIALGHTADDQAETVLMRLARGSGVDGLSAMAAQTTVSGVTWIRPLLGERRDGLRTYLQAAHIGWAEDPSNEDTRFDRVKARQMLGTLAPLGMTVDRLARTASHMREERGVLDWAAETAWQKVAKTVGGDVVFTRADFDALPDALQLRLLARALSWVSGNAYRPRYDALRHARTTTTAHALHGCLIVPKAAQLHITREWAAVRGLKCAVTEIWDSRWQMIAPAGATDETLVVAALGEAGLAQLPNWRDAGVLRQSLMSSPAVWKGETVAAAPLAASNFGWQAQLLTPQINFAATSSK